MTARIAGASLLATLLMTPAAHAAPLPTATAQSFNIPPQPLASALTEFGRQAGVQIFFPRGSIATLRSRPVRGRLTRQAALHLLLAGSPLQIKSDDGHTIVLGAADPITPTGATQTAGAATDIGEQAPESGSDDIVVTGTPPLEEERALEWKRKQIGTNSVMSGETIARRPGGNIVDILAVLPGVSAYADMGLGQAATGEAEFVSIRGIDSSYNAYTINGVRVPEADPATRALSLKMIAPYGLRSASVSKTPNAADYGDSIGGTVDIATPTGFQFGDNYFKVTGGANYNDRARKLGFSSVGGVGQLELGKTFGANHDIGFYATAYYEQRKSAAESTEAYQYIPATATSAKGDLTAMGIKYDMYDSSIERFGGNFSLDFRGDTVNAFIRGSYGHYKVSSVDVQHSITSGVLQLIGAAPYYGSDGKYNPLGTLAGSYFQARDQISQLGTLVAGSDFKIADKLSLSLRASYGYGQQQRPNYVEGSMYSDTSLLVDGTGNPVGGVLIDTANPSDVGLTFTNPAYRDAILSADSIRVWKFQARDVHSDDNLYELKLDMDYATEGVIKHLRWGGDISVSDRFQYDRGLLGNNGDNFVIQAPDGSRPGSTAAVGPRASTVPGRYIDFMGGNYANFRFYDRAYFGDAILPYAYTNQFTSDGTPNPGYYTVNDYNRNTVFGTETIYAAYAQAEAQLGPVQAVMGLRYEHTDFSASHWIVVKDSAGASADDTGRFASDGNNYDEFLPSLNLAWRPADRLVVRAAARRSFARPAFSLIAGPETYSYDDLTGKLAFVNRSNPKLKPTEATNLDAGVEWYPDRSAVIEAAGFYKHLSNFVFTASATGSPPNISNGNSELDGVTYTMPLNGNGADLYGVEFHARKQFSELGRFFGGFGVEGSLTLQDSKADSGLPNRGKTVLPRAPHTIYNAELFYERPAFSARLAYQFVGRQLLSLNNQLDTYLQPNRQLNFNATYRIGRWSLSGQVQNILNQESFYKTMGKSTRYLGTQDGGGNGSYVETGRFFKLTSSFQF
ncbi:TonB-dependent receptor [Sphingomonas kyeonggiensis]|uniref:TonB-dependent receptor n=1 Tax=Sphingomonas kyeonggiensis TaxID=1268553 RepID=A0A7W6NZ58_9SPHN|nr:TonB-dependent receptor [Sphingomonas kyeonggiensis]MBB4100476.1 TonB-dependent receptor [Sphingomonas kyeonggiensis]